MPYEWKIAIRFLTDGKLQTFFILLGIVVGVAVQIFLNSIITGVQDNLINETVGSSPHIVIKNQTGFNRAAANQASNNQASELGSLYINLPPKNEKISDYASIVERLDQIEEITAVSQSVQGNAQLVKGDRNTNLFVKGIELERADKIYDIENRIVKGDSQINANQILIGTELAKEYSLSEGDVISFLGENFIIEGVFDLESSAPNSSWIFMDIKRAQKLYNLGGYVNNIELQIKEPFDSDIEAQKLQSIYPDLKIEDWKTQNAQLLSALKSQSGSSITIQVFVLFAIALGIASVLAVSVVQKSRQIGILKAMGVNRRSASRIFVIQGGLLGFLGAVFGVFAGVLLIEAFIIGTSSVGGLGFEITIKPGNIIVILIVSTISGIVSSLIPARSSAKLNPMEVIRNG